MALSISEKIRNLLNKGLEPKAIAKRLNVKVGYVHTVKWQVKNKNRKVGKAPVAAVPEKVEGTAVMYDPVLPPVPNVLSARIDKFIEARVHAYLDRVLQ
jgi:hypothetical protein